MRNPVVHFALAFLVAAVCHAQTDTLTTIAALDLTGEGIPASQLRALSDRLRHELFATGRFRVMERARMQDILKEQGFQVSGCVSTECVVEAGQLIGVQRIVAGSLGKVGTVYTVNIRLINVETGEIERTAVKDCRCSIEDVLTRTLAEAAVELAGAVPPQARESQPDSSAIRAEAESYRQRADSLRSLGAYQDALVAYDRALALDPNFKEAWSGKGLALLGLKRYQDALAAYDRVLALDPNYKEAWSGKGTALLGLKRYQDALVCFDRALALDPNFKEAWFSKGGALLGLKRYQEALSCAEVARQLGHPLAQQFIDVIRQKMGGR